MEKCVDRQTVEDEENDEYSDEKYGKPENMILNES